MEREVWVQLLANIRLRYTANFLLAFCTSWHLMRAECLNTDLKVRGNKIMKYSQYGRSDVYYELMRRRLKKKFMHALPLITVIIVLILAVWVRIASAQVIDIYNAPLGHTKITAIVTAYTSSVDETDDTPFITASGERTQIGTIACPSKYDFGTVVVIEGRQYKCSDRMNKRYRDQERFDVWVLTKAEAFEWGIKELNIKIIEA